VADLLADARVAIDRLEARAARLSAGQQAALILIYDGLPDTPEVRTWSSECRRLQEYGGLEEAIGLDRPPDRLRRPHPRARDRRCDSPDRTCEIARE